MAKRFSYGGTVGGREASPSVKRGLAFSEKIFIKSIELFARKGFRATSMAEIAEACDVTKAALYYYFASKSELLKLCYERVTDDFWSGVDEITARTSLSPSERLELLLRSQIRFNTENRQFLNVIWRERQELDRETRLTLAQRERDYEDLITDIITEGQAQGAFAADDPRSIMFAVLGLMASIPRWIQYSDSSDESMEESIISLVFSGLNVSTRER